MDNFAEISSREQFDVFNPTAQLTGYKYLSESMHKLSDNMGRIDKILSLSQPDIPASLLTMKDKMSNMSWSDFMQLSRFMESGVSIPGKIYTEFQKDLMAMVSVQINSIRLQVVLHLRDLCGSCRSQEKVGE